MSTIGKIVGPPGTGKTTRLLSLVEKACAKYKPEHVGAVSFTNAAVEEIKNRAAMNLGYDKDLMQNMRTIHSLCWRLIGMKEDRLAEKYISDFGNEHEKYRLSASKLENSGDDVVDNYHTRENEKLFAEMNLMRQRRIPEDKWNRDTYAFAKAWQEWMDNNNYVDFTGILEEALLTGFAPDIDVLFVDESQDLSRLQLEIILQWAASTVSTILIGDADQCIFRFSGAQPEVFRDLENEWRDDLTQSYRVPPKVHEYSTRLISQAKDREDVIYKPKADGVLGKIMYVDEPDLSLDGTHMIICRCNYQVTNWIDYLIENKLLWHNPYRTEDLGWNPHLTKSVKAIKTYISLMEGEKLKFADIKRMTESVISKDNLERGSKTYIKKGDETVKYQDYDIGNIMDLGFTEEFMRGRKPISEIFKITGKAAPLISDLSAVRQQPRIIAGTIHSVKGGEADHVWLDASMPTTVYKAIQTDQQALYDEIRVYYVAVTRAKKTLGIMNSRKNMVII